jgi:hypothetical protein
MVVVDPSAFFDSAFATGLTLGDDSGVDEAVFFRFADVSVSPDGSQILVVDEADPFLRLFDSSGSLVSSFVPKGDGPAEARYISSADFDDRGNILAGAFRSLLYVDGGSTTVARIPLETLWPVEIIRGCGSWVIYGPEMEPEGGTTSWLWIASVSQDHQLDLTPILSFDEPYERNRQKPGWRHGLSATTDTVILPHRYPGANQGFYRVPCDGGTALKTEFFDSFGAPRGDTPPPRRDEASGLVGMPLLSGQPIIAGRVTLPSREFVASFYQEFLDASSSRYVTRLDPTDPAGGASVLLPGAYQFFPETEGLGIPVTRRSPYPAVTFVDPNDLEKLIPNDS